MHVSYERYVRCTCTLTSPTQEIVKPTTPCPQALQSEQTQKRKNVRTPTITGTITSP
jgi:hypothetical protein